MMNRITAKDAHKILSSLDPDDTLVVAHRDADGVTAAVQLSLAYGFRNVWFPKLRFEPPSEAGASAVVMVDMGAGLDLSGVDADQIIVIDHHPPADNVADNVRLYWGEWCASALVALIHRNPKLYPFALAGMVGDGQQGSELYDTMREEAEDAEPLARLRGAHGQTVFESMARMVNALNRLWGGDGARIAHRFLVEHGFRGFVEEYFIGPGGPDAALLRTAVVADAELRATAFGSGESMVAKALLGVGRLEYSRYMFPELEVLWIETRVGVYQSWLASHVHGNTGGSRLVAAFQPRPLGEPIVVFSFRGHGSKTVAAKLVEALGGVYGGHEKAVGGHIPLVDRVRVLEVLSSVAGV